MNEGWESFKQWITDVTTNPAFIAVATVLFTLIAAIVVIAKTGIGKKALTVIETIARKSDKTSSEALEKVRNVETIAVNKINDFTTDLTNKTKLIFSQFDFFETYIFDALDKIPNVQLKNSITAFHQQWETKKSEIEKVLGDSYLTLKKDFDNKVAQIQKEKESEIAVLSDKLDKLEEYIKNKENERVEG